MKSRIASACVAIAVMLSPVFIGAASAESDRTHAETYVKDSAITAKIKAKLAEEKVRSLVDIKVETDSKGEVELEGTVASQAESDKAIAIARAVSGVTSVKNKLTIKTDQ